MRMVISLFNEILNYLRASPHTPRWDRLSNSGDSELEEMGSQLCDLHGQRIQADYRMNKHGVENPTTARALVATANKMIHAIDGCRSGPRRDQIIEAIRKWEAKTNQ